MCVESCWLCLFALDHRGKPQDVMTKTRTTRPQLHGGISRGRKDDLVDANVRTCRVASPWHRFAEAYCTVVEQGTAVHGEACFTLGRYGAQERLCADLFLFFKSHTSNASSPKSRPNPSSLSTAKPFGSWGGEGWGGRSSAGFRPNFAREALASAPGWPPISIRMDFILVDRFGGGGTAPSHYSCIDAPTMVATVPAVARRTVGWCVRQCSRSR